LRRTNYRPDLQPERGTYGVRMHGNSDTSNRGGSRLQPTSRVATSPGDCVLSFREGLVIVAGSFFALYVIRPASTHHYYFRQRGRVKPSYKRVSRAVGNRFALHAVHSPIEAFEMLATINRADLGCDLGHVVVGSQRRAAVGGADRCRGCGV
jgi:hypothetical protein